MEYLIGIPLSQAEVLLSQEKKEYFVTMLKGGKDEEILTEPYVLRAREMDKKIELVATEFKTSI